MASCDPQSVRGLVLGGGGITGIAWETGLLAGLQVAGVDLTSADVVIGTSAGSIVGVQIRSGTPIRELYEAQLDDTASGERVFQLGLSFMFRFVASAVVPGSEQQSARRLGRVALRAQTEPESQWVANFIEKRIRARAWPEDRLLLAAVDAETGELRQFDRQGEVPLVEAVAASCAWPTLAPPITIGGRRYIDGGVRSPANADLATGCDRVVVIAPLKSAFRRRQRISVQLAVLGQGVRSAVVSPDRAAKRAIGRNVMDPSRLPAAARAGFAQAASVAPKVASAWI